MQETIDVLLATYNGEKYIKEQIDSILNQSYKNIRLIISDDCSKDKTQEILKEYEKKDNRIELHIQEKNLGVVKNIEFLLKQVKNKYYMLSDQDDVWLPEKIEKSLETLLKNNVDLVFGDLEVVDQDLKTMYPSFGDFMLLNKKIHKYINSNRLNYIYNCVTGCTILAKKETIQKILPLPKKSKYLIHDHWIGLMTSIYGKVAYMPEKYIKYRQHGNNQVGTDKISHGFKKLDQVRELFINVKLGVFGTYVENNNRFPEDMQKLNTEIYEYFKMIENKKNINFRKWKTFHELYKTESFSYYILNFVIMNLPMFGRPIFNIRYAILKLLGKR
jgi:glycosyltransferase